VPAALERLIRRCLAKDPEDRWQTARDMAAELRWIAEASSGEDAPVRVFAGRLRRATLWGAIAGTAVTAAVMATVVSSMWPAPTTAAYQQVTFHRGVVTSARFAPDGENLVYTASWEGQRYAAFLGRPMTGDARDLQLEDARILSVSRTGDMAVLFGPQNIEQAFGVRTLARVPMAGGARRDVLTGVVDADWIPGTDTLALIRDSGGGRPWTVEFPAGTPVHETRAAWSLRVSPDGSRVAFFEGPVPFGGGLDGMITVIDKSGRKSTLTRDWDGYGLDWNPAGTEVWFTATRLGQHAPHLNAVSLSGVGRAVHRAPDWLLLYDIAEDGRVLLTRNSIRITMACRQPGDPAERDLTWAMASTVTGLSPDGRTLIFAHPLGFSSTGGLPLFRRTLDGSPAVLIGEGFGGALSPDGKWVLALSGENLVLLPTGAGGMVTLPKGDVVRVGEGSWLGDSKRIVFTGETRDGVSRGYVQEVPAGIPRAMTNGGVVLAGKAAVRDETSVLGRVGATWMLLPIQGGLGRPVALAPGDMPLQWSHGGRYLYTVDNVTGQRTAAIDVFRVELATGARVLWKTLSPADPVGVEDMRETFVVTPDAQSYCYSYMRRLGDLFVVSGLK
jgi:hypothetical protein